MANGASWRRLTARVPGDVYDDLGNLCVSRGYGATRASMVRQMVIEAVESWRRENARLNDNGEAANAGQVS